MPAGYTENTKKWLELSEVDYVGPFVKAWLAFNSWYRSVYTQHTDRAILEEFRWQPNIVRNKIVPLIGHDGEDAAQFRAHIGELHHRLERCHIHSGHSGDWDRITFKKVFLRTRVAVAQTHSRYGWVHAVVPGQGNPVPLSISVKKGSHTTLSIAQTKYDLDALQAHQQFIGLTSDQQGTLLSIYRKMNPKLIVDLTDNAGPASRCGAYDFYCSPEDMFGGVCELVYSLRCSLFHGELIPDPEAVACYEPAYRIIRRFLSCI